MKGPKLLTYSQPKPGKLKCTLNLSKLYLDWDERKEFESRFTDFLESDPHNNIVYRLEGDQLVYDSEQLIPQKTDSRIPLLMVFGNPASRSVKEGMFFAFEGKEKEHRFWKNIVRPIKLLQFGFDEDLPVRERNKHRKRRILELEYTSRFRVGLCVFLSFPSGSSGPYSGTAGIKKMLGGRALEKLLSYEQARVLKVAKAFLGSGGIVITLQKDAWEGLRSHSDPVYKINWAKKGKLKGRLAGMEHGLLYGLPPTRLVGPCRRVLTRLIANA